MIDKFKIYLDRLLDGKQQDLKDSFPSDLLFCNEKELEFESLVEVSGKAYLAADHLIIQLNAKVNVKIPCVICTNPVLFPVEIVNETFTIPSEEVKHKIFCYKDLLTEELLLEIPQTKECDGGCPEREKVAPYLNKKDKTTESTTHFPFSGLE